MAASITGYAAYVPAYRLGRDSGVRGRRVVASFDENSTTMAVAAARGLASDALKPDTDVWFATTSLAYLDKTNATAIHAALLDLPKPSIPGLIDVDLPAVVAGDTTIRDVKIEAEPVAEQIISAEVAMPDEAMALPSPSAPRARGR